MTKKIDIEHLLRWAYRDELPKGQPADRPPDDLHGAAWLGGYWTRVDGGGQSNLGLVPGEPHADALTVAAAVNALATEHAFTREHCERMLGIYATCGNAAITAISRASYNLRRYVIRCAVLSPLEWDVGTPQLKPIIRSFNQRAIIYAFGDMETVGGDVVQDLVEVTADKKGRWPLSREPRAHIEFVEPSIGQLLEARAEYAAWHHALTALACDLAGKLCDHVALAPSRAAEPWVTGESVAVPRVLSVSPRGSLVKIPLAPRRGVRAGPPLESGIERLTRARREAAAQDRRRAAQARKAANKGVSGI